MYRPYLNAINVPVLVLNKSYQVQFENQYYRKLSPYLPFSPQQLAEFTEKILPEGIDYIREMAETPDTKRYALDISRIAGRGDIIILIELIEAQEVLQLRKTFLIEFSRQFSTIFDKIFSSLEHALLKFSTKTGEKTLKEGISRGKEILDILTVFSDKMSGFQESNLFSIKTLIDETITTMLPIWKKRGDLKNIDYQITFNPIYDAEITGSKEGLSRAIKHLIRNSFESMKRGGSIVISLDQLNFKKISCEIKDTGPGIPAAEQTKIFEPFYSFQKKGHSGLGLPFSLGIIQKHHGKLRVKSSSPIGTTFIIELPALNLTSLSGS